MGWAATDQDYLFPRMLNRLQSADFLADISSTMDWEGGTIGTVVPTIEGPW
jgi:hypothetical protein